MPNDLPPTPAPRPAVGRWTALLFGTAIFAGLAYELKTQQGEVVSTAGQAAAQFDEQGKLRPLAAVLETTRALKLVTVTVESQVTSKVSGDLWRGKASA